MQISPSTVQLRPALGAAGQMPVIGPPALPPPPPLPTARNRAAATRSSGARRTTGTAREIFAAASNYEQTKRGRKARELSDAHHVRQRSTSVLREDMRTMCDKRRAHSRLE